MYTKPGPVAQFLAPRALVTKKPWLRVSFAVHVDNRLVGGQGIFYGSFSPITACSEKFAAET